MSNDSDNNTLLKEFVKNNPHVTLNVEESRIVVERPWGEGDAQLVIDVGNSELVNDLNHLMFNPQFDAIIHRDLGEIEFVYGFLDTKSARLAVHLDRSFDVTFDGATYACGFTKPTDRLYRVAAALRRVPTELERTTVSQLDAFQLRQKKELPPEIAKFFEHLVPRSFIVKTSDNVSSIHLEDIARHINCLMRYYDRASPLIVIRPKTDGSKNPKFEPLRLIDGSFPAALAVGGIDDIVLTLLEAGRDSSPRVAFLYYYQVLEHAAFNFVDEKARRRLQNFVRDPAIVSCDERKLGELFALLTECHANDDVKMQRLIEECCDPDVLWREIEHDRAFFVDKIAFDGEFELSALIGADTSKETWKVMWMPKTFTHLTKIRNCLVHARERREDRVIVPSLANNEKIARWVPIVRRIAELVALKADTSRA